MRKLFIGLTLTLLLVAPAFADNKVIWRDGLTGGGTSLDGKAAADLSTGDVAAVFSGSKVYLYTYDATDETSESSPDTIKPDDAGAGGVWFLQGSGIAPAAHASTHAIGGSDAITITAAGTSVEDAGGLYAATDAEAAFAEAMTAINNLNSEVTVSDAKLDFGAKGDGVIHPGFNMYPQSCSIDTATSTTTLTCLDQFFGVRQIGKIIIIPGAGTAGATLETTITAVPNDYSVTLADAASTDVTDIDTVRMGHGTGCHMTAGSPIITCTEAVFTDTATDGGKDIAIEGVGAAGANLVTTISSVSSTTVATLANNASTTSRYRWMKFGTDDTTAIQNAVAWAADNQGKIYFSEGVYMYDDEAVIDDTGLIEGAGAYDTLFAPLPGYAGGWFLTLNDTWGQATPNPLGGADGGMGVTSEGISPLEYKQGVILNGFSVVGTRQLDPLGTHGIRTYNRVDRTIWLDVSTWYLNGTGVSLGLQGGTAYGAAGQMGEVRESQFFRLILRGCGVANTYKSFEVGTQEGDVATADWNEQSNILTFYTLQSIYNYGESGIYDNTTRDFASTREITFYDLKLHGFANYGFWQRNAIDDDLFVIEGDINGVRFTDADINGGHAGGAMLRIKKSDTTGKKPENVFINHYALQYYGDDIVVEDVHNLSITGGIEHYDGSGPAVRMDVGADITGKVVIDIIPHNTPSFSIADEHIPVIDFRSGFLEGYYNSSDPSYDATFETGLDGWIQSYAFTPPTDNLRVTTQAHTGTYSFAVTGSDNGASCENTYFYETYTNLPNTTYLLSFWAKANQSDVAFVWQEDGAGTPTEILNISEVSTSWTKYTAEFTGSAISSNLIRAYINYCTTETAVVYVDDLTITPSLEGGEVLVYNSTNKRYEDAAEGGPLIQQDDSSVAVTDTGTDGKIEFTVDGETSLTLNDTFNSYTAPNASFKTNGVSNSLNMVTHNAASTGTNYFRFIKARGTEASPSATQSGDVMGLFYFGGYNGTDYDVRTFMQGVATENWDATTGEGFRVDIKTKANGQTGGSAVAMTFQDDGEIEIPDLAGTYTGGSAYVCVDNAGVLFVSESACP